MNTNVIVALDQRRKKKDGTYPIILRLSRDERTLPIPTNYSIPSKDWDDKKREVKNSYQGVTSVTRLNNILDAKRKAARDIILRLEEDGKADALSLAEIKTRIVQQDVSGSFFNYAGELIDDLRKAERFGTARWYEGTSNVLKDFINGTDKHANNGKTKNYKKELYKGKDLKFKDITYNFLMKFETKHYADGNAVNGLSMYMRAIRAIYNKAIKAGLAEDEANPFKSYTISTEPTRKLALDWPWLNKIVTKKIDPSELYFDARNYFVAAYMMYGMSFADMAFLKKEDIVDGRIHYRRQKTSRLYDIKVTPALQEILSYYIAKSPESSFVFPIIRRLTAEQQDRDMIYGRKKYNKHLKRLAGACEIPSELAATMTTKVIRHSFATQARLAGAPIDVIKEMLGHSSVKVTEIYMNSLPSNTLDDFNEKVLKGLKPTKE
jgi:integrase